ncbi:MAG: hypothetical protein DYG83_05790 [Candidatus Brocadia sp. AMX2]|uniref:Uncharacterized conserved protein n=1 Tax=Candidatus Brocadia sinica JPN1 TaxID=1197129 RepID=A0ABQ0JXC1_9BACT|nr:MULTISPECIES: ferritin family protein [Brocadia]KXK29455.1 MAG: hypothetical protein UZ01_02220 [Candidatus Brocadia sinica]MBC6932053.1 hypothetical protein [Candidatus Brocadia sp.]MBL1169506.1 hypothetical protein [Candidatus Brocadia sp. AMX1]NOG40781.1 ferritin family protein [Planctomycetota bacterium]KAA0242678.1 MAG: hypothetical protein EDM70_13520 [Candidatus Brocadia sp. AMX2]
MKYENFNDAEALKIAINVEEEGLEFYSILMKNTRDNRVKEIFSKLASDEKEHLAHFQKAYLEITSPTSTVPGFEDYTVDLYLKYLVDTGIFTQKGEARRLAAEIKTDIEALKIGIQAEKDSILYYTEAAKNTKYEAGRKTFEQLVNEEKKHVKLLAEQMKELKKTIA